MSERVLIGIIGKSSDDILNVLPKKYDSICVVSEGEPAKNINSLVVSDKDGYKIQHLLKYAVKGKFSHLYLMGNNSILTDECIESHLKEFPNDHSYSDFSFVLHRKRLQKNDGFIESREYLFSIEPKLLNKTKQNIQNVCLYLPKLVNIIPTIKKELAYDIIIDLYQLNCIVNHIPYSLYKVKM